MPSFEYQALTRDGKQKTGYIDADSDWSARQGLRDLDLIPVEVKGSKRGEDRLKKLSFKRGVPSLHISLFARQLATLVDSGIPLEESLQVATEQTKNLRLKKALQSVRSQVREGYSLADSLGQHSHIFNQVFCSLVYAGEKTGDLGSVLTRLAEYLEVRQKLKSSTVQGLVYPIVLMTVALGVVAILMSFVVPKVVAQFDYAHQQLPFITRLLISISEGVQSYGVGCVVLIGLGAVLFNALMRDPKRLYRFHRLIFSLPGLSGLLMAINSARLLRTLHILVDSGVPLLEALKVGQRTVTNLYLRHCLAVAITDVESGSSLHKALSAHEVVPMLAIYMIANGEKSGELSHMLGKAAEGQEDQLKSSISMFVSLFEPALIITLGGVVMFIVLAILLPILQLNNFSPV